MHQHWGCNNDAASTMFFSQLSCGIPISNVTVNFSQCMSSATAATASQGKIYQCFPLFHSLSLQFFQPRDVFSTWTKLLAGKIFGIIIKATQSPPQKLWASCNFLIAIKFVIHFSYWCCYCCCCCCLLAFVLSLYLRYEAKWNLLLHLLRILRHIPSMSVDATECQQIKNHNVLCNDCL